MKEQILEILQKIELDKEYIKICQENCNFSGRYNLNIKDVEPIIKSFDSNFKYIAKDKTFMKETTFQEFTVRFFIGFKSGIVGFGYLIWKEGDQHKYYKGNLMTLSKQIDPKFEEKVEYNSPIANSLKDFEKILSIFFELFKSFKTHFEQELNS